MARCTSCNRFVSYEEVEPEIEELEFDKQSSTITGSVHIVNACNDCGDELTEATLDVQLEVPPDDLAAHTGDGHDLTVEYSDEGRTSKVEGKGRGAKTFYGYEFTWSVVCSCKGLVGVTGNHEDYVQASLMDSLT